MIFDGSTKSVIIKPCFTCVYLKIGIPKNQSCFPSLRLIMAIVVMKGTQPYHHYYESLINHYLNHILNIYSTYHPYSVFNITHHGYTSYTTIIQLLMEIPTQIWRKLPPLARGDVQLRCLRVLARAGGSEATRMGHMGQHVGSHDPEWIFMYICIYIYL